jgi:hypothetical protein
MELERQALMAKATSPFTFADFTAKDTTPQPFQSINLMINYKGKIRNYHCDGNKLTGPMQLAVNSLRGGGSLTLKLRRETAPKKSKIETVTIKVKKTQRGRRPKQLSLKEI